MKKIIIIGGANEGYSESITRRMIKDDYFVYVTYEKENLKKVVKLKTEFSEEKVQFSEIDLSSRDSLQKFVKSIDTKIDGLIFAHFFFDIEDPNNFDHSIWDKSLLINLTAPNYLIHELKDKMNKNSSNVILTSTEAFRGSYAASAYSATKAAIHNLVKSLANTLGQRQIRINAVPAGWIGGVMDTDEIFNKSRDLTPLARLGKAEEVANVVAFLMSSESSFINGTTLITDGGYLGSDPLAKFEFDELKKK